MYRFFILTFVSITSTMLSAQSDQKWFSYLNEDSTLSGFKNAKGEILSEPKIIGPKKIF